MTVPTVGQSDLGLLRAFVSRIRGEKAEARAIKDAIREIYAEAKAAGFNKTVLGEVVVYIERREKDPEAHAERSAHFDSYLEAYDGTKAATHAHAPEVDTAMPTQSGSPTTPLPRHPDTTAVAQAFTIKRPSRPEGCCNPGVCASSYWGRLCHGCQTASDSSTADLES